MVGLKSSLGGSRLFGDFAAEIGASRHDFSKPQVLSADQLFQSGPKGGFGSPQDLRYKRILRNEATLQKAAESVMERPYKLRNALSTPELLDAPSKCLQDARQRLGKVVGDKVQHAFLETSFAPARSFMRSSRLSKLRKEVSWARGYKEHFNPEVKGSVSFMEAATEALKAMQRAHALKEETFRSAQLQDRENFTRSVRRRSFAKNEEEIVKLPGTREATPPRQPEEIVREAMRMLQKWKLHEEVAHVLCDALLSMAEVCGDDFKEEMGRGGLGVLASSVADVWSSKADVCRSALRLLAIASMELFIAFLTEHLGDSMMVVHLGLEALNRMVREDPAALETVAIWGGRELLEQVEEEWGEKDEMIYLHALNLRRRLKKTKVKSQVPKKKVTIPPADVMRIRGCFEAIDADGSGLIEEPELGLAFQMIGMKLNSKELHEKFVKADLTQNGVLEWPEFLFLMSQYSGDEGLESNFTEERLAELRDVFNLFDEDGSGSLDAEELNFVLRSVGLAPSESEVRRMIDEVDADGSGMIEWPEFLFLMSKNVVKPDEQHRFAFEFFDKGKEGKIQKDDFVKQMQSLSKDFTAEELEMMFEEAKFEDGDTEQLTYKEFVKMMMR